MKYDEFPSQDIAVRNCIHTLLHQGPDKTWPVSCLFQGNDLRGSSDRWLQASAVLRRPRRRREFLHLRLELRPGQRETSAGSCRVQVCLLTQCFDLKFSSANSYLCQNVKLAKRKASYNTLENYQALLWWIFQPGNFLWEKATFWIALSFWNSSSKN